MKIELLRARIRLREAGKLGDQPRFADTGFAGDQDGYFNAFESRTGKLLWRYRTGSPIHGAAATTYMLDGRQYVLIPSGMTITAFELPEGR